MSRRFEQDATRSIRAFAQFVSPVLQTAFNAKRIEPTENHGDTLATLLDRLAGIDGAIVDGNNEILLYASRVQFGKNYKAFSIRFSRPSGAMTEYEKLARAIQRNSVRPAVHVQTFVDDGEHCADVGIVKTCDLIAFLSKHQNQRRTSKTGEDFLYAEWRQLPSVKVFHVDGDGRAVEKKKAVI